MSDEENDEIDDLEELPNKSRDSSSLFQVSGWENDNEGIEEEKNPHENPEKELLWAAENGQIDVVKSIIESNDNLLHVTDKDGYTPLHRACYNNHPEIVKYLLQNGAKHDASTIDNWQPLHSACKWNNIKCAALLLSHGADINASSKGGVTPLHLAAGHTNSDQLLKLFLAHPELIHNGLDSAGDTALDIARRAGRNDFLFEAVEMKSFDYHLYEILKSRQTAWTKLVRVEDLTVNRTQCLSAAGFFDLTLEDFGSMISAATTYLVILLQMG